MAANGFDSSMVLIKDAYAIVNEQKDPVRDVLLPFHSISHINVDNNKTRVMITTAKDLKNLYIDLNDGETLLDVYSRILIPISELKKRRNKKKRVTK